MKQARERRGRNRRPRKTPGWTENRRQLLLPFMGEPAWLRLRLLAYWRAAAEREGYVSVQAALEGIFAETGSVSETARRMGFDRRTIREKLKIMGLERPGPGGANNPWGRGGKPEEA